LSQPDSTRLPSTSSRQVHYWNDPDVAADVRAMTSGVSIFAKLVEADLPRGSRVVELGCGAGDDAAYFAENGHHVMAIDISAPLIEIAEQRFANLDNLEFRRGDIARPLDVGGDSVDAVFARLSIHYFDDETTARIFGEVHWVLRPAGRFYFACKSTEDPLYGKGVEIAPDMFDLDGHVRHFFSPEYALELLEEARFINVKVESGTDEVYGQDTAYIKCFGIKP